MLILSKFKVAFGKNPWMYEREETCKDESLWVIGHYGAPSAHWQMH